MSNSNNKKSFHKKSLGQHFLSNPKVIESIVNSAPNLNETNIIEIGPGAGALTIPLLTKAKTLHAVEYDIRLTSFLDKLKKQNSNFSYSLQDALTFNFEDTKNPYAIISNLPYNVGTQLLLNWLKLQNKPSYMLLMFQKEVAKRISAEPNNKEYGRLSVICNALCNCTYLFDVPKEDFDPAPKVDSGVVLLTFKQNQLTNKEIDLLENVTNILFNKRRKMIGTTLKKYKLNFEELEINPTKRPEELCLTSFIKLGKQIKDQA